MKKPKKYLGLSLLVIGLLTIIIYVIASFIQPLFSENFNNKLILFFAIFLTVSGFLSHLNEIIDLMNKLFKIIFPNDNQEKDNLNGKHKISKRNNPKESIIELPNKKYHLLFGRDTIIEEILTALREPLGKNIIGIDGMGGIGKTALTREIADRAINEKIFDELIWEQASKVNFEKENFLLDDSTDFDDVLNSIARKLGYHDVLQLSGVSKTRRLREIFAEKRILIILDNLETGRIDQDIIIDKFLDLLSSSKAILTSRKRFKKNIYSINLPGLDEFSAIQLIKDEAREKNISRVTNARIQDLKKIVQATGGSPLAIKLVTGQLWYQEMVVVLNRLKNIQLKSNILDENEYINFYKDILFPSWKMLSKSGKELLITMTHFAPGIGGRFNMIQEISEFSHEDLVSLIEELWKLSLIEITESSKINATRYYIHALTQYFVLSDIIKMNS